jgi:septum formation protein
MILASRSPRRKELLSRCGVEFFVYESTIAELTPESGIALEQLPEANALLKAREVSGKFPQELVLGADTMVICDGRAFGKPENIEDARRMLRALSGKTHQVITGVCLTALNSQKSFATVTDVTFCGLSEEEIDYYVECYRPMDKAGSYGIQEWIGFVGVESISGSYFNVMGLPIQRLYTELKKL